VRAPLKLHIILESVYWLHSAAPLDTVLLDLVRSFHVEMSHFSREEFDKYSAILQKEIVEVVPHLWPSVRAQLHPWCYYFRAMYIEGKFFPLYIA
jgi:hypothetical protein